MVSPRSQMTAWSSMVSVMRSDCGCSCVRFSTVVAIGLRSRRGDASRLVDA